MNSEQGLFLSQGPSKGIIDGSNNCHLGFGILLFQVRDFKGVGMEDGSQGTAFGITRPFCDSMGCHPLDV